VLVATDVAARGIHVDGIDLVVHFDPPNDHKDYLHRSGRTARAGNTGTVVSLAQPEQVRAMARLHEEARVTVTTVAVHPGHEAVLSLAGSGTPVVLSPREAPGERGPRRQSGAPARPVVGGPRRRQGRPRRVS
jgi:superfamily II DNA/RNA helicase